MKISNDIIYVGVNDHKIDLFEGQYKVPNGMAYNSYIIFDNKIAVMDTVDKNFTKEWLANILKVLQDKAPDYLIVQHMEPDHSASILDFLNTYPKAIVVASVQAFTMMKNFYGNDFSNRRIVVSENSTLNLGKHTLTFITAPMVHWPEVIVTYDNKDKVLFSADGFGKFGANDVIDEEGWACEARRYYFGIAGKYGMQVQALLKKAANLDIKIICPLHGPVLNENLSYYLNIYNIWSSYQSETDGIFIAYTSIYGHTKEAVNLLVDKLKTAGYKNVAISDLAREDMYECVEDAFRYSKIILATTTYNMDIFPFMKEFINHLVERNYQNKAIGFIENGSWSPNAIKVMKKMLEPCKNITYLNSFVTIVSSLNDNNKMQIDSLVRELLNR